ncbi:type III polyketide synthase [Balneolaceae bacterium YR4-1]|uniref:Type III polyketide synthase n=1 Tax=Halalkalibaculum roseum TaxID=2709311 RepID=A0A6M1T0B8_9BACT|nr:type III polyketide synthase [Halalkalibaculum roseum]NGP78128.1 type III polyketide synthase [Halalkalibaculum roseum]
MAVFIEHISTLVPEHSYQQDFLRERMKEYVGSKRSTKSIIHRIYSNSGIEKRHTVINDFRKNGHDPYFFSKDGNLGTPSTGSRNDLYTVHAKEMFVELARQLVEECPGTSKDEITHVITVSCTGFFAPEPAFEIVKELGLHPATQRYHLGFMGCFAAFPALKMAKSFCESDPDAKVMVICLELCSIHLQDSEETDNLISASVFADGASGVLVSSSPPEQGGYRLEQFAGSVAKDSEKDMAWTIGDTGFDMVLSTYVPEIIESNLEQSVLPLFKNFDQELKEIDFWAIHPGGRAILDKIEKSFSLRTEQLEASRQVLNTYGNMSSATIFFVLKYLLEEQAAKDDSILAMAFGPGLTIESGLLTKV